MDTEVVRVTTGATRCTDLTETAATFVRNRGDGVLHLFVPHATAALALIEIGSGSDLDLADLLDRIVSRDHHYRHHHGTDGHGADHLIPAILSSALTVPVLNGALALGTWQSIVLVDTNVDNPHRQVRLSFLRG